MTPGHESKWAFNDLVWRTVCAGSDGSMNEIGYVKLGNEC